MLSSKADNRSLFRKKRLWLVFIVLVLTGLLFSSSNARMMMQTAPDKPHGATASPPITASTLSNWETQKPKIKLALQREIYGEMPQSFDLKKVKSKIISTSAFNDSAHVEEVSLQGSYPLKKENSDDQDDHQISTFKMVLVTPLNTEVPVPVIMMENFCPNHDVIPIIGISKPTSEYFSCSNGGVLARIFTFFFGRYITTPPIEMIMNRGYALAAIYPSETFPDRSDAAGTRLSAPNTDNPWGTVAAWAFQFSLMVSYFEQQDQYSDLIAYGHSRYGKSALLAAGFDSNIDAVIAHQSGTGGASLSRNKEGETVADIMQAYPHWFAADYAENTLSVDQHHLLALIAPRPILLGNARRDVWSDPVGAFKAAQGATSAYKIYGSSGLDQTNLSEFRPDADIAFWIRPGTHGVVKEDWPAFLEFLDAHFN